MENHTCRYNHSVLVVDKFEYDHQALADYFDTLNNDTLLIDIEMTYREEYAKYNNLDMGDNVTIREVKKHFDQPNDRTDIVSILHRHDIMIRPILEQLKELLPGSEPGQITFFLQRKGNHVPPHTDYPYRKNSLLLLPIFTDKYKNGSAVTYYNHGQEIMMHKPTIMDVMVPHGVRDVDHDRLALHIEIPNLEFWEVDKILGSQL